MQSRVFTGIVLEVRTDALSKVSYIKVLTTDSVEFFKLPTNVDSYKYGFLLSPKKIITGEIVKTKKNWVLRSILTTKDIWDPQNFTDYLSFTQGIKLLAESLKEGEVTNIFYHIENYFASLSKAFDPQEFEYFFLQKSGFTV